MINSQQLMSKYKYEKQYLFSNKKIQDIEIFMEAQEQPIDLMQLRDNNKNTVIHHCAYHNHHRLIEFYIKYHRKQLENQGFRVQEIKKSTKILLDQTNHEGYTAAHYAGFRGHITTLKLLEKYSADLIAPNALNMSQLHLSAQSDKINTILYLHHYHLDYNAKDVKGSTPLHWACFSGSQKTVEYLLAQPNILLNEQDQDGQTPLHLASVYGHSKIVKQLLLAGADRTIQNKKGYTALKIAKQNEFDKIILMLDDKYSLLDYIKFICNAKIKYKPKNRSYIQPFFFLILYFLAAFLLFGVINIFALWILAFQTLFYSVILLLFLSLITPPKSIKSLHSYDFYVEKHHIGQLCMSCIHLMRPREHHCYICQVCVSQYDHHCSWINNCIGKKNLLRFYIFIILVQLALIWTGFLIVKIFLLMKQQKEWSCQLFQIREWIRNKQEIIFALLGVIFLFIVLFVIPLICLIMVQSKNLLLGKTTFERFSKSHTSILTGESISLDRSDPPREASCHNCIDMCFEGIQKNSSEKSRSTETSFIKEY